MACDYRARGSAISSSAASPIAKPDINWQECRVGLAHAVEQAALGPAAPSDTRPDDGARAGHGAGGLAAHHLPRRRLAGRGWRSAVRRPRANRRLSADRWLSDPADWPHHRRGELDLP